MLDGVETVPLSEVRPVLQYVVPPKSWCIGLNYRSHAVDIEAVQPEEPASIMKPAREFSLVLKPDLRRLTGKIGTGPPPSDAAHH